MRSLRLIAAGLLACGPALAQSVPPTVSAPTGPNSAVNLAYMNNAISTAVAAAAANAANAANLTSGTVPAARLPLATPTTPGAMKPGAGLVLNPATGAVDVDSVTPLASTAPPTASTALVDVAGKSYTIQQIAATVASINGSASPTPSPSPTPASTPAPAPASDGTLTGLPATTVAGQPLSAATWSAPLAVDRSGDLN